MKQRFLASFLAGLSLLGASTARAQESGQSWTPLFNGKDLLGWKTDPRQPGNWRVEDGAIVCDGDDVSHLFSERGDFGSFHLRVEARINATGNSGVFFDSEFGLSRGGAYPAGYEAQIHVEGDREKQLTGSLYGFAPVHQRLIEPDRWFTLEVTKDGRFIAIKINGKTAARYKDEDYTYAPGHFALQQMAGTTIAFRRIDVLEPCPAQYRVQATEETVPLITYWNEQRNEIATVSTPAMKRTLDAAGYVGPEMTARVLKTASGGTAPLLLYESGDGREHMTVSTEAGKKAAKDAGYQLIGEQGHVYTEPGQGTVPLNLYWNPDRNDYFTCSSEYPRNRPERQGFEFVRTEGHVIPSWRNRPRPWAILLCKFEDKADYEPRPASFYKEALTEAGKGQGREFDYFRDVSGGVLDLTGSKVFGWMTINHRAADLDNGGVGYRAKIHAWAVEAAKAQGIDLTPFWSVAVFVNHDTDLGAFGPAGNPMGVVIGWGDANRWEPNTICHELGHGFGLMHARLARPLTEYGDGWCLMGGDGEFRVKTEFGPLGPGFNAPHLNPMGCLAADRIWTANPAPGSDTLTLAALNKFDADGFLAAVVPPVPGATSRSSHWIEFRRKSGWDAGIPQDTVLVHEDRGDDSSYILSRKNSRWDFDAMQVLPGQEFKVARRNLTIKAESFDARRSTAKVTITIDKADDSPRAPTPPEREYMIVNAQSGRVLEADIDTIGDEGTKVALRGTDAKDKPNRRWNFVNIGDGTLMIMNVQSGRVLNAYLDKINVDGTDVGLWGSDAEGQRNRTWRLAEAADGTVLISNAQSGRLLEAELKSIKDDGTKVWLFGKDARGRPNRRWRFVEFKE